MLISIDKFIFKTEHNIAGLKKSIKINIDKKETITHPVYTHLGGFEQSISFSANILLSEQEKFSEFEALVKKGEPLKISALDLAKSDFILITSLEIRAENFFKTSFESVSYYSKSLSITGYLIEG